MTSIEYKMVKNNLQQLGYVELAEKIKNSFIKNLKY